MSGRINYIEPAVRAHATGDTRIAPFIFHVTSLSILASGLIYATARTGWLSSILAPLVVAAAAMLLLLSWRDWELGVKILLVIVVFEGAIRKWFLPSASEFVYFYKDLIMLALLFGYLMERKKPALIINGHIKLIFIVVAAFVMYAVAVIVNPSAPHPLVGLLGVKAYCLYMPLALIVPRMFSTKEKLIGFLRWYLIISIPVIFLGMMQFMNADTTASINKYAWDNVQQELGPDASSIARFEDSSGNSYVRVTGTFSYISGMAIYLPIVYALLLSLISLSSSRQLPRASRWLYYFVLSGVVTTSFMTGSRSAVINLIIITMVFFGLTSHRNIKRRLTQLLVIGGVVIIALTLIFPAALDALRTRTFGSEEQIEEGNGRIINVFRPPLEESSMAGAFGYGIGATQNYVPALMSKLELENWGQPIPPTREEEPYRVMMELGVVGYIFYSLLRFTLIITLWRICLSIKNLESKSLVVAALAILTIQLFTGGAVVVHTQNVFQWFLVGMCLALNNIEMLRPGDNVIHNRRVNVIGKEHSRRQHQLYKARCES